MKFQIQNSSNLCLIPYIGNKSRFANVFDQLIPTKFSNLKFYDVFGGGAGFTLYACERFGSKNVIYNDNNHALVNFITFVKLDPGGLIHEYKKHQKKSSRNYYNEIRDKNISEGLVGAGRFFYLAKNAFSGKIRFNTKGKFNCPMRKETKCRNVNEQRIFYISSLIKNLKISAHSFEEFYDTKSSFIYLDPPYSYNTNRHYSGSIDVNKFIVFLNNISMKNKVLLSEKHIPKIFNLSKKFYIHDILIKRNLQYFTNEKNEEKICANYSIPKQYLEDIVESPIYLQRNTININLR